MNSLEEYTTFAATIVDLLRDGDELSIIDNVAASIKDAKRTFHDEKNQYGSEIERLNRQVASGRKNTQRSTSKESYEKQLQNLQKEHNRTLKNITNLQEQRLKLQTEINHLKQSPSLYSKQKELQQLEEEMELEK